jgi:quinol monooxygenase YgiN
MRWLLCGLGLAMTMLGGSAAQAQDAAFYTVTYIEVGPAAAKDAMAALKTYRDAGRREAGNVRFDLLQRIDRSNQFTVLGAWKDQAAFDAHASGAATTQMHDTLRPLMIAPPDTRQHNALAVAAAQDGGRGSVFAVTHVDVIPPQKDHAVAALNQLVGESRKQDGSLRYDIWQQTNRPNHFTSVSSWKSRKAFDAHQVTTAAKDFRAQLATMTGALYDERLYHVVK